MAASGTAAATDRNCALDARTDATLLPFGNNACSDFWAKNYAAIKGANMKLPILLRESSGTAAKLTASYGAPPPFPEEFDALPSICCTDPLLQLLARTPGGMRCPCDLLCVCAEYGVEKTIELEGLSADKVGTQVEALMKAS